MSDQYCGVHTDLKCDILGRIHTYTYTHIHKCLTYVSEFEKRGNFVHFPNFCFKTHISGTIVAMNVNEYSSIILLHSLQIASPAHFRYGRGECTRPSRSKNAVLCPSSGQQACSDF